jgi:tetratricopeptide (TPR) repeat protein
VAKSLLVEYYSELPAPRSETAPVSRRKMQAALEKFKKHVAERYNEGTLQRLIQGGDTLSRRAAVLALGMIGCMKSNQLLAARLRDEDRTVRRLAVDALWSLWFRADNEGNNQELQRVRQLRDNDKKLAALDALIAKAPGFAEAYNQRAILNFQVGELQRAITDCEKVLKLNPCHFGAQVGMAQCYMGLNKPRAALKAFRNAYRLNPDLEGVEETIHALEEALRDEERKRKEDR